MKRAENVLSQAYFLLLFLPTFSCLKKQSTLGIRKYTISNEKFTQIWSNFEEIWWTGLNSGEINAVQCSVHKN